MTEPGARPLARRRHTPRGSRDVRRRALRLDDAAVIRLRERGGWPGRRLGGNGFRRAGQPGGRLGGSGPPTCPRVPTRSPAGLTCDGPRRIRRARVRDGLGVAGRAAAGDRLRPPRRRPRPGGARPGAARRRAGQGALQLRMARPHRCWIRRWSRSARATQCRDPDALCVRLDRNGFPAAVGRRRAGARRRRRRDRAGAGACRPGCASTRASARSTAVAATRRWS